MVPPNVKDLTPEQLASTSCAYWINLFKLEVPEGPFTFKDHEYLIEPLEDQSRVVVEQKGTQGGFTTKEAFVDIHGCLFGKYPAGVAFAMPTDKDVQKFSKSKWDSIVRRNKHYLGKYIKSSGKGVDSAALKRIGESFIHFIGTTLSRNIDGEKESATLRSFSCDKFVCDELDMMDLSVIEKLRGRFGHSKIKQERYISNPTGENYGINELFNKSDQRYWHRLCSSCDKYTCPELEFMNKPESICKLDKDGFGFMACIHCGAKLPLFYRNKKTGKESKWIPLYRYNEITGRLWSQLNSSFHDPVDIMKAYYNPPEGNIKDVMRYRLGQAYTAKEDQLRPSQVLACCSQEPFALSSKGPCAMGVDVGFSSTSTKHIVIGVRTGDDRYEIIYVGTRKNWNEVHDLAMRFNVQLAGIDVAPDVDAAKIFQKSELYPVWLCDYKVGKSVGKIARDDKSKIIKINRTEMFDSTHRIIENQQVALPRRELLDEFIKQVCNPFKQGFKNEKTGIPEYRYIGSNDHYRHALNYFYAAVSGNRIEQIPSRYNFQSQPIDADNEYQRCQY